MKEWIPNNALKPLDVLVGRWNVVASEMSFFPDQSFTSGGQDSFEWFDKGGYLIMTSRTVTEGVLMKRTSREVMIPSSSLLSLVTRSPPTFRCFMK